MCTYERLYLLTVLKICGIYSRGEVHYIFIFCGCSTTNLNISRNVFSQTFLTRLFEKRPGKTTKRPSSFGCLSDIGHLALALALVLTLALVLALALALTLTLALAFSGFLWGFAITGLASYWLLAHPKEMQDSIAAGSYLLSSFTRSQKNRTQS